MLKKLTPNLMVEDVNATIDFYRDVLGFAVAATVPDSGPLDWAMVQRDDVALMFQARRSLTEEYPPLAGLPIGGALTLYTEVAGVQDLHDALKGRVEIVLDLHDTFYGTREFAFKDRNGYILTFSEART
jgi:uncharacterized glyoxalase superfamily protein PhnB